MRKSWTDEGWNDYLYWQKQDKRTREKINRLIKSIEREGPMDGEGHPEALKYRPGYSREINEKDRLVYDIEDARLSSIRAEGIIKRASALFLYTL